MAHEIFNEPERAQPLAALTRWLGALTFAADASAVMRS
jgi:hypothetical protein